MERYLKNFKIIRKINNYIVEMAKENDVPVIENVSISQSVEKCLEIITERFHYIDKMNGDEEEY
jgi:2-phosphoglycerate kinase